MQGEWFVLVGVLMGLLKFLVPGWGVLNYATVPPEVRIAPIMGIFGSIALILCLLYLKKQGMKWAVYFLVVLLAIGVVGAIPNAPTEFRVGFISGALVIGQAIVQAVAIFLLLKSVRQ